MLNRNRPWLTGLMMFVVLPLAGCSWLIPTEAEALEMERAQGQSPAQAPAQNVAAASAVRYQDPVVQDFSLRLDFTRRVNMPVILEAAEASAQRVADHPSACINVPYGPQNTFAEELLNRAGGLANALPPEERRRETTPNDILLVSARSWEQDADKARKMLEEGKERGWLTVLFASKQGMPEGISADFVIDNGAPDGSDGHASINSLANVMNAWLWCSEYAAALTRSGLYPGVLYSVVMSGAKEHNEPIQRRGAGRKFLGTTRDRIEPGTLSTLYLGRVAQLLNDLDNPTTTRQVASVSREIANQLESGGNVIVASCTHFLMGEVFLNRQSAMRPLHVVWRARKAFGDNVKPGDMVFWIGYIGMSTPLEAYHDAIRATGAKLVTSYVSDADPANNSTERLAHIEQHWTPPDAELAVPFRPGFMAPVSGIDQGLIFRMVDARVARLLKEREAAAEAAGTAAR